MLSVDLIEFAYKNKLKVSFVSNSKMDISKDSIWGQSDGVVYQISGGGSTVSFHVTTKNLKKDELTNLLSNGNTKIHSIHLKENLLEVWISGTLRSVYVNEFVGLISSFLKDKRQVPIYFNFPDTEIISDDKYNYLKKIYYARKIKTRTIITFAILGFISAKFDFPYLMDETAASGRFVQLYLCFVALSIISFYFISRNKLSVLRFFLIGDGITKEPLTLVFSCAIIFYLSILCFSFDLEDFTNCFFDKTVKQKTFSVRKINDKSCFLFENNEQPPMKICSKKLELSDGQSIQAFQGDGVWGIRWIKGIKG